MNSIVYKIPFHFSLSHLSNYPGFFSPCNLIHPNNLETLFEVSITNYVFIAGHRTIFVFFAFYRLHKTKIPGACGVLIGSGGGQR